MRVLLAAWLLATLSGCALTTERIQLQYAPPAGVTQVEGASAVTVAVEVKDSRLDKTKVSSKKNAYGMETAPIVASEDVDVTVRRAIESELKARGFALGDGASVTITGDITRFYNDHKMGFWSGDAIADFSMSVLVVSKTSALLYSRQIVAQGTEPNTQLATGNNAMLALNQALANGIRELFGDPAFLAALTGTAPRAAADASH